MISRRKFENKDLVLRVSPNCDPRRYDQSKYDRFLDALCEEREYQKEAIRGALRYLVGGEYRDLRALVEENYRSNSTLQEKYVSLDDFLSHLQLPNTLSCSIDHATATGKSYVMYGIARIMLAEGAVDQVLVLCPSNTIESGLTEKFRDLSGKKELKDLLPRDAQVLNPRIVNASSTIRNGDICVENIHATYRKTKSAIEDSLTGKGQHTLVLNDEAHHIMNPSDRALKKWKEFLLDPKYGFKYVVNVSGTCYIGNDYFTDVIHRFSIKDAMEARFVKLIRYVAEDTAGNEYEKLQKIYDNHVENRDLRYNKVKPLTIMVTKNITRCKTLTEKLISFMAKKEKISKKKAEQKVLIVTSANEHKQNVMLLEKVDDKASPVEWITSVSMLTEGWDVKNVFQVVPHEERAFNSKLLIAQVLGRGLRIPKPYLGHSPVVTVFNHDKWASSIKHLVDEVLEIETRICSYPVEKKEDYDFDLHNVKYERIEEEVEYPQEAAYDLLAKGYISYSSQEPSVGKATTYVIATTGKEDVKTTEISYNFYSVEEVAQDVFNRLLTFDQDAGTKYAREFPEARISEVVRKSLEIIGDKTDKVNESNRNQTLAAFGVIRRRGARSIRLKIEAKDLFLISTKEIKKTSAGVASLRFRDDTVFYDDYSLAAGTEADRKTLRQLIDDDTLPKKATVQIKNKYDFKTPVNVALVSYEPERKFLKALTEERNTRAVDSWIKSPDVGFYSIGYSWRKGEHPKQGSFNPDFFIKTGNDIIVVEIKLDDDISAENKAKLRYAREHFERVNSLQKQRRYLFKFLSPISFEVFFKSLREGTHATFKSELEAKLEQ